MIDQTNKTLCRLPWNGFSNDPDGKVRPCCISKTPVTDNDGNTMYVQTHSVKDIFHSDFMKNLRQEFRENKKPIGCSTCWVDEANGYKSKRLIYSETNNDWLHLDFDKEPELPVEYQMIISNSCNLKCRSCSPSHSTQWQNEWFKRWGHKGYDMPHGQAGDEQFVLWTERQQWYHHLKRLEIVGGEPFFIKQWRQIWDELIELNLSKNITVDMSSNATLVYPEVVDKLCENFRNIGIGLSIDGINEQYEYLRHLGKWDVVKSNVAEYVRLSEKHPNLTMQVTCTIGWQNAWYLPEIHQFFYDNAPNFRIWNNIIHYPHHMTLWAIPQEFKAAIADKWLNFDWKPQYRKDIKGILNHMNSASISDEEFRGHMKVIKELDAVRGEDVLSSFPHVAIYLQSYIEALSGKVHYYDLHTEEEISSTQHTGDILHYGNTRGKK